MGHYSSSYEHDEELARRGRVGAPARGEEPRQLDRAKRNLIDLRGWLPDHTPSRFMGVLEDLHNWITIEQNKP